MQFRYIPIALLIFILATVPGCSGSKAVITTLNDRGQDTKGYVLQQVNIVPMTIENRIIENATVLIRGNKIVSINQPVPDSGVTVINAKGKWLMPGLIDMHVHNLADISFNPGYPTRGATLFMNTQDFMLLYIANGVTTVLELSGRVEHFGQRNEVTKGEVIGPRIAIAILIDGGNSSGNTANTPDEGRQTVRIAKAQGYEFIKVYSRLNIETFKAIVDEANRQGMKVVGHIPNEFKGKLEQAFVPHFDMVAHAEEYAKQTDSFSEQDARRFAALAKANNTWLSPTLITMERIAGQARSIDAVSNQSALKYVHPLLQSKWLTANNYNSGTSPERIANFERLTAFHLKLVKAFKEAGVPMVAGTDAGTSGVIWGFSMPDELELLVKAGLTTQEALAAATRLPATWLGIDDKTGTIEAGKFADLVLLDNNPLDSISNIRKIAGVFANGEWISRATIDKMLEELANRNTANKDKYDWEKRSTY